MSEKRFIVETVEIIDVDTDESRITEVITDIVENCSYETFEDICDMLNSQHIYVKVLADENEQLRQTNEKLNKEKQRLIYHMNQPPER